MELSATYNEYRNYSTSLETTLSLLQDILNERLTPEYSNIKVQASNGGGRVNFCFTIFLSKNRLNEVVFSFLKHLHLKDTSEFENKNFLQTLTRVIFIFIKDTINVIIKNNCDIATTVCKIHKQEDILNLCS